MARDAATRNHESSRRFRTAQCETREADLHQQRIAAHRTLREQAHGLARHEAKLAQATRDWIIRRGVFNTVDDAVAVAVQFAERHRRLSNCKRFPILHPAPGARRHRPV